jgi:hypothetical protein
LRAGIRDCVTEQVNGLYLPKSGLFRPVQCSGKPVYQIQRDCAVAGCHTVLLQPDDAVSWDINTADRAASWCGGRCVLFGGPFWLRFTYVASFIVKTYRDAFWRPV